MVDDGGPPRDRPAPPTGTRLPAIGAPAARALAAAGLSTLEAVAAVPERELAALHGVGPIALAKLRDALTAKGLARPS
ncbi:DNA-binding protein [Pseudonocardia sp. S2-4]|uniref:DNA-binding protein n=1 Tax=Pseudonocardia humida TaxID=2800819 RepID=A0ABT1A0G2_9PSEU|nr:DNA-binding protein [Pseudonocardia humida]